MHLFEYIRTHKNIIFLQWNSEYRKGSIYHPDLQMTLHIMENILMYYKFSLTN